MNTQTIAALEAAPAAENSMGGSSPQALAAPGAAANAGTDASPAEPHVVAGTMFASPVVVGENGADFEQLQKALVTEFRPQSLYERFLVDDIANAQWEIRRFGRINQWLMNASVAKSVVRHIAEKRAANYIKTASAQRDLSRDEYLMNEVRQDYRRYWEVVVFHAVSGDAAAIAEVVGELGSDSLGLNAFLDFDALSTSRILIERAAMPVRAIRDSSFRQIDKIQRKRRQQTRLDATANRQHAGAGVGNSGTGEQAGPMVTVHAPKDIIDGGDAQ